MTIDFEMTTRFVSMRNPRLLSIHHASSFNPRQVSLERGSSQDVISLTRTRLETASTDFFLYFHSECQIFLSQFETRDSTRRLRRGSTFNETMPGNRQGTVDGYTAVL